MPQQGLCLLFLAFCLTIIRWLRCALPDSPLRAEFTGNEELIIYCVYTYNYKSIAISFARVYASS